MRKTKAVPRFIEAATGRKMRVELRCSIPGCPWIAEESQEQKVDVRRCTCCGKKLHTDTLISEKCCACRKNVSGLFQRARKITRNVGLHTRYLNRLAKRSAA